MKQMVEIGYKVMVLNEKERALVDFLVKHNLLKMPPREITVFDSDNVLEKAFNTDNQEVWCLKFAHSDLMDCDGVFTSKEKAVRALEHHCERCKDIWELEVEDISTDYNCYGLKVKGIDELIGVMIEKDYLDVE